ncbi:MAG TPA: Gfo/Idh/MocA family oxidoreductase [Chloroflexota bacterium]|nr:Gfo/Idh/MocA family oxidoreductase [Chloroflexota bacterium]
MTRSKIKVGVIGCGTISGIYFQNMKTFDILDVVACADIDLERAKARATEFGIPKACTVDELLADSDVQIVVNLTIPKAHAEVGMAVLESGKSVHGEKPLAVRREDGRRLLDLAASKGLRVGSAPDTFLGGGLQTCRKLIDDGWIGEPVAANAFFMSHGPEHWHPDPDFYYQPGAGPMFDMGPYYLTALCSMLGPIRRVTGSTKASLSERLITSQPKYGTIIKVNTPTHLAGIIDFANGVIGTITTSFDVWGSETPRIEIHGTEASLSLPDPNTFGGPVKIRRAGEKEWSEVPLTHRYTKNSRGIGVLDLAYAIRSGRPHRANGEIAYHVLDVMHAFDEASRAGQHVEIASTCSRPTAMPVGIREGTMDD